MSEKGIIEINIIYDINRKNNIRIFGSKFVKNNKNICKMIIDNGEYEIAEEYNIKSNNNNKLKIKLKGIDNINNMSSMFDRCSSLLSLPDISKLNTNKVTDMNSLLCKCTSLSSLPDISKWNTNKVTNMSCMFDRCSSLLSLPDISKWNIKNVINMSGMFYNCVNIILLQEFLNVMKNK